MIEHLVGLVLRVEDEDEGGALLEYLLLRHGLHPEVEVACAREHMAGSAAIPTHARLQCSREPHHVPLKSKSPGQSQIWNCTYGLLATSFTSSLTHGSHSRGQGLEDLQLG